MSKFDQFRFSFVFLGLPKIGHNRYNLRLLLVASLFIFGYDATASSNCRQIDVDGGHRVISAGSR